MPNPLVAASILSCNYLRLEDELHSLQRSGVDLIHLDVMDGHFVPEISFGALLTEKVVAESSLPCEVHLMIEKPEEHVQRFIDAGCFRVIIHLESQGDIRSILQSIKSQKAEAGLSIKPGTPLAMLEPFLDEIDLALLMTVEPGWGGQGFLPESLPRLDALVEMSRSSKTLIEVDGGINAFSGPQCAERGCHILVSGSFITAAEDRKAAVAALKQRPG